MSREGEAVQGAVPREEGFASVLRRDAWVKPFFFRYRKALALALFLGLLTFGFASALMFTSGYLVSASAVVETILFLHLPLIFVRIFGVGKPILAVPRALDQPRLGAAHDQRIAVEAVPRAGARMPCSSAPRTARATCWAFWPRISGTFRTCTCAPCSPR